MTKRGRYGDESKAQQLAEHKVKKNSRVQMIGIRLDCRAMAQETRCEFTSDGDGRVEFCGLKETSQQLYSLESAEYHGTLLLVVVWSGDSSPVITEYSFSEPRLRASK